MLDLQDRGHCPGLEEIGAYVGSGVFDRFCAQLKDLYRCTEKIEFSACSLERGWNIKFRKAGRSLCTVYPRQAYFTVLVVVGRREKEAVEAVLPACTAQLRELYRETREGNGQRWLMIDLEDEDELYRDVFRLLEIRAARR